MKHRTLATISQSDTLKSLAAFLFVALFVFVGMYRLQPPRVVPANAPLTEFSAERAIKHVQAIAQKPHPPGSLEHTRVHEYILSQFKALGLEPQVQKATPVRLYEDLPFPTTWVLTGDVRNIVVRLEGTDNSEAVLIAGHYDSVLPSLNASDGGSAVATSLEVARALLAGPPLKNDVIFLLTDGEEDFILGARAFVSEHPWLKDIGVVLHFVARGTGGPSILFETSPENGWLIEQFAKAAPHPIGNSLAYAVYQLMPNDTDFTQYKDAGIAGLNFAYIDHPVRYHTLLDSPENLDKRSLQHHGAYALALARHFGNLDSQSVEKKDVVFFDILGFKMIYYPESWVLPLTWVVAVVYLGIVALGFKRRQLTLSGVGFGVLALLLIVIAAFAIVAILEQVIIALHSEYRLMLFGNLYNSRFYLISFVSIAIAVTSLLYTLFRKKTRLQNLMVGELSIWLILMLWSSFNLPGASYLLVWPLLFNLLALGGAFYARDQTAISWRHLIVYSLCAAPGIILLAPTIYLVYLTMPPLAIGGLALVILTVLLLGTLIPHLALMSKPKSWLLPVAAAAVGVIFVVIGSLTAGFNVERPKPSNVLYGFDADVGEAFWISEHMPDEWTSQFFPNGAQRDRVNDFFVYGLGSEVVKSVGPAPKAPVTVPDVELLEDSVSNGVRKLCLRMDFPHPTRVLRAFVYVEPDTILKARVNGLDADVDIRPEDESVTIEKFPYDPLSEDGLELSLETTSTQPVRVVAISISDGLPQIPNLSFNPRPAYMIPSSTLANLGEVQESTMVRKSFEFPMP